MGFLILRPYFLRQSHFRMVAREADTIATTVRSSPVLFGTPGCTQYHPKAAHYGMRLECAPLPKHHRYVNDLPFCLPFAIKLARCMGSSDRLPRNRYAGTNSSAAPVFCFKRSALCALLRAREHACSMCHGLPQVSGHACDCNKWDKNKE